MLLCFGFWSNNGLFENTDKVILIVHIIRVPGTLQLVFNGVLKTKPYK